MIHQVLEKLTKILQENLISKKISSQNQRYAQSWKNTCISINIFGYQNGNKYPIYILKNTFKRHVKLLLIKSKGKLHYVFTEDSNSFIYNQALHHNRKHFWRYSLQSFNSTEISERHTDNCLKISGNKWLKCLKKMKLLDLKIIIVK